MLQHIAQGVLLWAAMGMVASAYKHGGFMALLGGLILAIMAMNIPT